MPTDPFVPLTTAASAAGVCRDFHVLVAGQPDRAQPFRAPGPTAAPSRPASEPRVSLQREGDRIVGIHIQCSCGQLIDLACVYQAEPPAAS